MMAEEGSTENEPISITSEDDITEQVLATFYTKSKDYWSKQPATVNGMLGGYEYISDEDIKQSQKFLDSIFQSKWACGKGLALDCGAGIGRVSKHLLLKNFDQIEMVDVTSEFIEKAKTYIGDASSRVAAFHCDGLQNFQPVHDHYDCIWMQWVLCYLKDDDLVDFFIRCKRSLRPNGICVLKENFVRGGADAELDCEDASYTRPRQGYLDAIHKAGMHLIKEEKQKNFPAELFEVRIIAFK